MTITPLVSIITCFLNEQKFLQETIDSVLAQDYPHWELLLIDDGSTDNSSQIAQSYAAQYPGRIYYYDHQGHSNIGLSGSRNSGIKRVKGTLVAFLDADDVWLPQKLSQQVGIMQAHPAIAMICEASKYWYSWEDPAKVKQADSVVEVGWGLAEGVYEAPQLMIKLYPLGNTGAPCPSGLMCRKAALERVGGFEAHFTGPNQMYEDQGFLSKIYASEAVYVSKACNNLYRQRVGSLVQSVTEGGKYHAVRLYFLEWLEKYLQVQGMHHPEVHKLLQKALAPYRRPLLHYLTDTLPAKGKSFFRKK